MNILRKLSLSLLLALPLAAGAASRPATPFTDAEIDQMLAPIALYPDAVLSHVLIAATVPDDVDAAAEWLDRHPEVKGRAAVDAVERMPWDPSVKALVAFPDVVDRMHDDPDWTEDLGLAFLEQEATVMDRVQVLRDRADDNGTLDDVEHVKVVREKEYIYLEPAVSHVVYVPYYDPWYVYGSWWWASYPPHCWNWWAGYPAHYYGHSAFFWGVSYHYGPSWYVGSFNWPRRHVVVTRPHRYYSPSPGYSGRTMRRDNVHHDLRRSHDSRGWRQDTRTRPGQERRDGTPVRRGHRNHDDSGGTHRPQGPRGGNRRSWGDVNARLSESRTARREDSSHRAYESTHHGGSTRRADNPQRRDGWLRGERAERAERATRPVEGSRSSRSYSTDRGEARRESRPQSRPERSSAPAARSEPRGGGREARSDGGSGRSAGRGSSHGDGGNGNNGARVRARGDR